MSDVRRSFFGRKADLAWLTRQVESAGLDAAYPPVILIHGAAGIGKTALIDAWIGGGCFWDGDVAWLRTTETPRTETLAAFVERLARSATAREAALRSAAKSVAVGIATDAAAAAADSGNAPTAYTPKGTVRASRLGGDGHAGSGEVRLAENLRRRLHAWLRGRGEIGAKPLLVVILDRFDRYPPPFRSWLGRDLLPALCSEGGDWSCAFLLTGTLSWKDGKQDEYWNVPAEARSERELGPLLLEDCLEWVQASGYSRELADVFYEESEGVPARLGELLSSGFSGHEETDANGKYPAVLAPLSPRERRWVQAACFQGECTLESLGVLLGGEEGARALDWLAAHFKARLDSGAGSNFRVRDKHRDEVRAWMRSNMAHRWQHFQRQAGNYEQLRRIVPDVEDRATLAQIAPIRFFTPGLVEKLLAGNE